MVENDLCTFDFFTNTVKPARNVKKDLAAFMKKRAQYTISNLKLPELDGKESKYRPLKHIEPIENSDSLKYTRATAVRDRKNARSKDEEGQLDNILKNIREILINSNKKLKTISPDLIDQIYQFEMLNDFSKQADLDELVGEQLEQMNKMMSRRKSKRGRSHKASVYSQFGHESTGQANLMSQ